MSEAGTSAPLSDRFTVLTNALAGTSHGIDLVALIAFALIASFQVNADLAAGVRLLTLIDI